MDKIKAEANLDDETILVPSVNDRHLIDIKPEAHFTKSHLSVFKNDNEVSPIYFLGSKITCCFFCPENGGIKFL
jgi:hypothetical protein